MFKLIQSSPTGEDCTCLYSIELDKEYTVCEFINTLLHNRRKDWGDIRIDNSPYCSYKSGTICSGNIPDDLLKQPIFRIVAHGGYTRMDYGIILER